MVLSGLFRQKQSPMISLLLSKEPVGAGVGGEPDLGPLVARLEKLDCKIKKLKRHSKRVFRCNQLNTLSEVQACCEENKRKDKCKKKRVRICTPEESPCAKKTECADSASDDDLNCDNITFSDSASETGAEECEAEDEATCPDIKEEESCPDEVDPCKDEKQDECEDADEPNNCDESNDKKCQVMSVETGGTPYLLSQADLDNALHTGACIYNIDNASQNANNLHPLVIPIITTASVHTLSSASKQGSLNRVLITPGRVASLSEQVHSSHDMKNESELNMDAKRSPTTATISLKSTVESVKSNDLCGKRSKSMSKTSQKSQSSSMSSERKKSYHSGLITTSPGENNSIVYIVQNPSQPSIPKFPRHDGSICIDASNVFIQNSPRATKNCDENIDSKITECVERMSEMESVLSEINPPAHLESKVSLHQPEVEPLGQDSRCSTNYVNTLSGSELQASHEESVKLVQNMHCARPVTSVPNYDGACSCNINSDKDNIGHLKEDGVYVMHKIPPHLIPPTLVNSESQHQNSSDSQLRSEKSGTGFSSERQSNLGSSQNQSKFISDCDAVKPILTRNISDCNVKNPEVQNNVYFMQKMTSTNLGIIRSQSVTEENNRKNACLRSANSICTLEKQNSYCSRSQLMSQSNIGVVSYELTGQSEISHTHLVSDGENQRTLLIKNDNTDTEKGSLFNKSDNVGVISNIKDSDKPIKHQSVGSFCNYNQNVSHANSEIPPHQINCIKKKQTEVHGDVYVLEGLSKSCSFGSMKTPKDSSSSRINMRCDGISNRQTFNQSRALDNNSRLLSPQFVSDCDAFKHTPSQFVSDCDAFNNSDLEGPFVTSKDYQNRNPSAMKKQSMDNLKMDSSISAATSTNLGIRQPAEELEFDKRLSLSYKDQECFRTSKQSQNDCSARKPSQVHFACECNEFSNSKSFNRVPINSTELSENKTDSENIENTSSRETTESQTQTSMHLLKEAIINMSKSADESSASKMSFKNENSLCIQSNNESNIGSKSISMDSNQGKSATEVIQPQGVSLQKLSSQNMDEASNQNETIAMLAQTNNYQKSKSHDLLVIHCSNCNEVCIARIIEKNRNKSEIWTGQRGHT